MKTSARLAAPLVLSLILAPGAAHAATTATFVSSGQLWTLGVLALAGLLWTLCAPRLQTLSERAEDRLRGRMAERERIARDLHDTLLQDVQGLTLRLQSVVEQIPADLPARQALENALDRADDVIVEGRDRVKTLRADAPDAMHETLADLTRRPGLASALKARMVVEGTPRALHAPIREEIEQIAVEALSNTRRHARARRVEIDVSYGRRALGLRFRDDGEGLDQAVIDGGGREGRRGLTGMSKRANAIASALEIRSRPGAGTEIELTIPAAVAYLDPGRRVRAFVPRSAPSREA